MLGFWHTERTEREEGTVDDFREFLAGLPGKMSQKKVDAIVEHVEALMPWRSSSRTAGW